MPIPSTWAPGGGRTNPSQPQAEGNQRLSGFGAFVFRGQAQMRFCAVGAVRSPAIVSCLVNDGWGVIAHVPVIR